MRSSTRMKGVLVMNNDTLMTYEQWNEVFKKQVKKYVHRKVNECIYVCIMFLIFVAPMFIMIVHWVVVGY